VDIKRHDFAEPPADEFIVGDLRDAAVVEEVVRGIDEVYQLAADMGGAGYIFTGEHDACVLHNSASINLNVLEFGRRAGMPEENLSTFSSGRNTRQAGLWPTPFCRVTSGARNWNLRTNMRMGL